MTRRMFFRVLAGLPVVRMVKRDRVEETGLRFTRDGDSVIISVGDTPVVRGSDAVS